MKQSAKDAVILINGYLLSTFASAYDVTSGVDSVDLTGFSEGVKNFGPGLFSSEVKLDMFWDSATGSVHDALSPLPTGYVSIMPEGGTVGLSTVSMAFMQSTYGTKAKVSGALEVGSIDFKSYGGSEQWSYYGVSLAHGIITNTLTGTSVLDPSNAARTAACGAILHVWGATVSDTYVVKVQHSTNNSTWADLLTFLANGTAILAERQTAASGTINKYRRVIATRTGAGADPFGFSVSFYIK